MKDHPVNFLVNTLQLQKQGFVDENSNVPKNHENEFLKMLTASETSEF